jgi:hypothetical protein
MHTSIFSITAKMCMIVYGSINGTKCTGYNIGLRLSAVECVPRVLPIAQSAVVLDRQFWFTCDSKILSAVPAGPKPFCSADHFF